MKKLTKFVALVFAFVLFASMISCTQQNSFTVSFLVDGEVVKTEVVNKGESATAPDDPEKIGHYFINWDQKFDNIQSDLEINAIFQANVYQVTFYDEYGKILNSQFIDYGTSAIAPEMSDGVNKIFKGWNQDFSFVTADMDIKPVYQYTSKIEFYDGEDKLDLGMEKYVSGEYAKLPTYQKEGHEFIGWFLSDISLTPYFEIDDSFYTDLKLYARWVKTEPGEELVLPSSTYKFNNINKVKHSSGDYYVYQAALPAGAPSGATNYDWSTSDETIATVSQWSSISIHSAGYCVLTAVLKSDSTVTINCIINVSTEGVRVATEEEANEFVLHTVTFKGKDGETIGTAKCGNNGTVIYPTPIKYEGYKFVGWDKENYNITEDTEITALYEEGVNNYQGKSFAIIGDSISTFKNYIPEGFSCFYPYPTADVYDVNLTWWMQSINNVGGTLFVNNSYSGSCVATDNSSATQKVERLEYTLINGVAPDVILVYMGSNDCASQYVTLNHFNLAYKKMIENLRKLCPNSEIILCTLVSNPSFYSASDQEAYNNVIETYGEQFGLKVFDLSEVSLAGKLVDSAHPMTSGMTVFADKVTELLLKE